MLNFKMKAQKQEEHIQKWISKVEIDNNKKEHTKYRDKFVKQIQH